MNRPHLADTRTRKFDFFIFYTLSVLSILLIVLTLFIPKGRDVLWINGKYSPFQDWFFSSITLLGDGVVIVPLIAIMLFVRFYNAIVLALVGLINGVVITILKRGIFPDMKRPIAFLDTSLLHFVDGVTVHSSFSFPSGHTATAFAMLLTLALFFKNRHTTVLLIFIARLVGYSRIYLPQHYLMDVTAGALIGTISSLIIYKWKLFYHLPWAHQRLRIHFQIKRQDTVQPSGQ